MKSSKKYFLFDVETGGLDEAKCSLLTLFGHVLDCDLNVLGSIDLKIKPSNGIYQVVAEGLKMNKIDIVKHDALAITEEAAAFQLENFLREQDVPQTSMIPTGHNVSLDIRFVSKMASGFRKLCSHRTMDTAVIGQYLQLIGKIPEDNNGSLAKLCLHYGIDPSKNHDAQGDVEMTLLLLRAMALDGVIDSMTDRQSLI